MMTLMAAGLTLVASLGATEVVFDGDVIAGKPITLTTTADGDPADGVAVRAIYRENAHESLRFEQDIGRSGPAGRLEWTPVQPGVVVLSWEGGSRRVSVLHDGVPISGVLIALFAGLLLVGGTGRYFWVMARDRSTPV